MRAEDGDAKDGGGDEQRAGPGEAAPVVIGAERELKITTGRLAIGWRQVAVLKNWLLSAVNSSGAVSPLIRAKASRRAGEDAAARPSARGSCGSRVQSGAPSATPASRRGVGCSCSTSSVVRVITGTASSASATAPAKPEKPWNGAHQQLVDEQADQDRRRREQHVVEEADDAAVAAVAGVFGQPGAGQDADDQRRSPWPARTS